MLIDDTNALGLYIHIPFCRRICSYCDFCRVGYHADLVDRYLLALGEEFKQRDIGMNYRSIYIGGGTPSCLSAQQLRILLTMFQGRTQGEYTLECNPDDISLEFIQLIKEYGVNRLSVGVQSFDDHLLSISNRIGDSSLIREKLNLLQVVGFNNYSIDLIYGLPGQTMAQWVATLAQAMTFNPPHISLYGLTIEPHAAWKRAAVEALDDDTMADMYLKATEILALKYEHYEISNFAKPGYQSKHNLIYWHYDDFLGIGLNASSKYHHQRIENTDNFMNYFDEKYIKEVTALSLEDEISEYMMMNLRLSEGVYKAEFFARFGVTLDLCFKNTLEKDEIKNQMINTNDQLVIKSEYWLVSNDIIQQFLL